MNRDPFVRLALVAACSGYLVGLVVLAGWQGWPSAVTVGVLGVLLSIGLVEITASAVPSLDEINATVKPDRPRTRRDGKPVDFQRLQG